MAVVLSVSLRLMESTATMVMTKPSDDAGRKDGSVNTDAHKGKNLPTYQMLDQLARRRNNDVVEEDWDADGKYR